MLNRWISGRIRMRLNFGKNWKERWYWNCRVKEDASTWFDQLALRITWFIISKFPSLAMYLCRLWYPFLKITIILSHLKNSYLSINFYFISSLLLSLTQSFTWRQVGTLFHYDTGLCIISLFVYSSTYIRF